MKTNGIGTMPITLFYGTGTVPATLKRFFEVFELFDKNDEVFKREGKLPHWYQPGVTYFITFRTADSVPHELIRNWHDRREKWLINYGIDPASKNWKAKVQAERELQREYGSEFTKQFMEYLDRGMGACLMRDTQIATIVAESILYFNEERYLLSDLVVMPNHVHVLVCLYGDTELEAICKSWKTFSARKTNRILNRNGRLWQEESFDHLVRSPERFEYFRNYIATNPRKARLKDNEFHLYQREQ